MNYHALDEALSFIETGSYNSDFVINDMFRSLDSLNESVNIFNESSNGAKGFKAFLSKLVEVLKKAVSAIGKFFAGIWQKFQNFIQKCHDEHTDVKVDINKLRGKNKEFDEFMNTAQYEMTDNFVDIRDAIFKQVNSTNANYAINNITGQAPDEYDPDSFREFVNKVFADNTKKVTPDECIKIHNRDGQYSSMIDGMKKKVKILKEDEKDLKDAIKSAEKSIEVFQKIEYNAKNDLARYDNAKYSIRETEIMERTFKNLVNNGIIEDPKATPTMTSWVNSKIDNAQNQIDDLERGKKHNMSKLKSVSMNISTLSIVISKLISAINTNRASYMSMKNELRKYTHRADEYLNA